MYLERILKLLFASTVALLFSLLMFFLAFGYAGNGGEYWGFDGYERPHRAAQRIFESGDQRLLRVDLTTALGERINIVPIDAYCNGEPFGNNIPSRAGTNKLIHGVDSIRLARKFAFHYNNAMAIHVGDQLQPPCFIQRGRYYEERYFGPVGGGWLAIFSLFFFVFLIWASIELSAGPSFFRRCIASFQSRIKRRRK